MDVDLPGSYHFESLADPNSDAMPYIVTQYRWTGTFHVGTARRWDPGNSPLNHGDLILFLSQLKSSTGPTVLVGYFEVNSILPLGIETVAPAYVEEHRAIPCQSSSDWDDPLNVIMFANRAASWNKKIPGAGTFTTLTPTLRLTRENAMMWTEWDLPVCVREAGIEEYGLEFWRKDHFRARPSTEDFAIGPSLEVIDWARRLIDRNSPSGE